MWTMQSSSIEALRAAVMGGDWSSGTLRALADAQDKAEAVEAERRLCTIGRRVRVPRGDGTARAMICSVNNDGTLDVVFDEDDSEDVLLSSSARALEAFEEDEASVEESTAGARVLKERGSALFRLKDYASAQAEYQKCLDLLGRLYPLQVGATAMVNSNGALKVGTVSSISDKTLDLVYDNGDDDDDDLSRKRILAVLPNTQVERKLMLTTQLNVARCAHHADKYTLAVLSCTLAGGIAKYDSLTDNLVTAKVLRARAHLAQSHLKQAIRDSNAASVLAANDKQVVALARDVDRAKRVALKANKKLAKEVSDWVSTVMNKNSSAADALGAVDDDLPDSVAS